MNCKIPRIVITGAPASGKTDFIQWLRPRELFRDFIFFDKLARSLLTENPGFRHDWHEFHREIYSRQIKRENDIAGKPFVTDRGTIDAFAFHPETMTAVGTTLEREYQRYSLVIHLGTTAGLGDELYRTDTVRRESRAEALEIERALTGGWGGHPRYRYISPKPTIDEKFEAALQIISDEIAEMANI